MTARYPAAVYRAARDAFTHSLATIGGAGREMDVRGALAQIQGRAGYAIAHDGLSREITLAAILGTSAVPAVLRVRARHG